MPIDPMRVFGVMAIAIGIGFMLYALRYSR